VLNALQQQQLDYERNAILAVSSLYGIDILEDNVAVCTSVFLMFSSAVQLSFQRAATDALLLSIRAKPIYMVAHEMNAECRSEAILLNLEYLR